MLTAPDPFDPNCWPLLIERDYRLYAGEYADIECLVDEEDYRHFGQWLWNPKIDPTSKIYFRRSCSTYYEDGTRSGAISYYLHREILIRAEGPPPTKTRCIADHWDGNSLNNRRSNLRWVTKRENNRNRFGQAWHQRSFV